MCSLLLKVELIFFSVWMAIQTSNRVINISPHAPVRIIHLALSVLMAIQASEGHIIVRISMTGLAVVVPFAPMIA